MNATPPRIVIIGAGIAGISLADALLRRVEFEGAQITMIDGGETGPVSGAAPTASAPTASATPMALLNPATGRDAKLVSNASTMLPFTLDLLRRVQHGALMQAMERNGKGDDSLMTSSTSKSRHIGRRFLFENGVLRPAPDADAAERMRARMAQDPWPTGWAEWQDPKDVEKRAPGVFARHGALWIPVGCHVAMPCFLAAAHEDLAQRGVNVKRGVVTAVRIGDPAAGRPHEIDWLDGRPSADGMEGAPTAHSTARPQAKPPNPPQMPPRMQPQPGTVAADLLLFTIGSGFTETGAHADSITSLWPDRLGLHAVKGQILKITLESPAPFECAVSMRGYLAPMRPAEPDKEHAQKPISRHTLIIGSTFEHQFDHTRPDRTGRDRLLDIARSMMPDLKADLARANIERLDGRIEGWAAVRVHRPPERAPILAIHPMSPSVLALTGFGSKGLLLAPFTAQQMVGRLALRIPWRRTGVH